MFIHIISFYIEKMTYFIHYSWTMFIPYESLSQWSPIFAAWWTGWVGRGKLGCMSGWSAHMCTLIHLTCMSDGLLCRHMLSCVHACWLAACRSRVLCIHGSPLLCAPVPNRPWPHSGLWPRGWEPLVYSIEAKILFCKAAGSWRKQGSLAKRIKLSFLQI